MGKSLLILVLILHTSLFSGAQFVEVGGGIAGPVNNIYASTLLDKIVATGNFRMAGADSVNFIAAWDGLNWDNLGNGASEFGYAMNTAIDFESKLIINADFQLGYDTCWLYMWNGNSWNCQDSAAPNSRLMGLTIIEDTLYACGWMDSIGSTPVTGLARWDGNTWSGYQFPLAFWGMVDAIKYNGELIVGGNFIDTLNWIYDIAVVNGNQLSKVGGTLNLGGVVYDLCIYNGSLFIGGYFSGTFPIVFENLIAYDGISFHSIGSPNFEVWGMEVYDNQLYVWGTFSAIDGIPYPGLARWDGQQWHSVTQDTFNNVITSIAFYHDELYVAGGFTEINGQPVSRVAKYTGPLKVAETAPVLPLSAYPNPASEYIKLQWPVGLLGEQRLRVTDLYGRTILTANPAPGTSCWSFDCSSLPPGSYQIILTAGARSGRVKVAVVR
ncbi:MAG TPA: hypothetical protein P5175_12705 [Anaerohalosphaeraceae bacterium]|nr:hypothetical protein [Anaerohalosphaeraceae bacterium]